MSNRCTQFTQSGSQCHGKTRKSSIGVCEHGCEKHNPQKILYNCGRHGNQLKCWFTCVNCSQRKEYESNYIDSILIIHPGNTDFYCSSCKDKSDIDEELGRKYVYKSCLMCDLCDWTPESEEFFCNEHYHYKENCYDKGLKYKKCKFNDFGSCTIPRHWVNEEDDFWCLNHQEDLELHTKGYIYKSCHFNDIHPIYKNWSETEQKNNLYFCLNRGWVNKNSEFWCEKHQNDKKQRDNGKIIIMCEASKLNSRFGTKTSYYDCIEFEWSNEGSIVWCNKHKKDKEFVEKGRVIKECEYYKLVKRLEQYDDLCVTQTSCNYYANIGSISSKNYKFCKCDNTLWWVNPNENAYCINHKNSTVSKNHKDGKTLKRCTGHTRCLQLFYSSSDDENFCTTHKSQESEISKLKQEIQNSKEREKKLLEEIEQLKLQMHTDDKKLSSE